jgi:hypothetical protein
MPNADHLRKVDDHRFERLVFDHDVEFVEVSVNETNTGESDNELHKLRLEQSWSDMSGKLGNLSPVAMN